MKLKTMCVGIFMLLALLTLAACSTTPGFDQPPTAAAITQALCPTSLPCPAFPTPVPAVVKVVPFEVAWAKSAHANAKAPAFTHWDNEEDKLVPAGCANCHSTPGYQDFIGADGSPTGTIDAPVPVGTVITCEACHNNSSAALTQVKFPSGVTLTDLGPEARCMVCHQGRASTLQVNDAIETAGLSQDADKVSDQLKFINIHYLAAASTQYGVQVKGGYEYPGKAYDVKYDHVKDFDSCVGCHDAHSLVVKIDQCATCHAGVQSSEDLKNIRMDGSTRDYNGNGDVSEGIAKEIEGLQAMLLQAIQAYGKEKAGKAIAYSAENYPYFLQDINDNGKVDEEEAKSENAYSTWSPRLLKAAYNYHTSIKDPGAYAHNGKYIIQMVYDSIEDLNSALTDKIDLSKAHRIDSGHFAGSQAAFRHWDGEDGLVVPGACSKCHTAGGLPFALSQNGITISMNATNGLACTTCHDSLTTYSRYPVGTVTFPSGAQIEFNDSDSNLCLHCHQGRESKVSLDKAIAASAATDDQVSDKLRFINPHYLIAGATIFGSEAKGAYEYNGQVYSGRFMHLEGFQTCTQCHNAHDLAINVEQCGACHGGIKNVEELKTIRKPSGDTTDYDGDGDANEGLAGEIATMQEKLYTAFQAYATRTVKVGIVYSASDYPYFFKDTNSNGEPDTDELNSNNSYNAYSPRLLRAAYNYQWSIKDPGAYSHNPRYIMQVLYDSIRDLGGDVSGMTRPPTTATP